MCHLRQSSKLHEPLNDDWTLNVPSLKGASNNYCCRISMGVLVGGRPTMDDGEEMISMRWGAFS